MKPVLLEPTSIHGCIIKVVFELRIADALTIPCTVHFNVIYIRTIDREGICDAMFRSTKVKILSRLPLCIKE